MTNFYVFLFLLFASTKSFAELTTTACSLTDVFARVKRVVIKENVIKDKLTWDEFPLTRDEQKLLALQFRRNQSILNGFDFPEKPRNEFRKAGILEEQHLIKEAFVYAYANYVYTFKSFWLGYLSRKEALSAATIAITYDLERPDGLDPEMLGEGGVVQAQTYLTWGIKKRVFMEIERKFGWKSKDGLIAARVRKMQAAHKHKYRKRMEVDDLYEAYIARYDRKPISREGFEAFLRRTSSKASLEKLAQDRFAPSDQHRLRQEEGNPANRDIGTVQEFKALLKKIQEKEPNLKIKDREIEMYLDKNGYNKDGEEKTLEQIGQAQAVKISKERVRQIIARFTEKLQESAIIAKLRGFNREEDNEGDDEILPELDNEPEEE